MNDSLDITLLKKIPELNRNIILEIEPLAPLSMVSELPGSYYKTLKAPSKKMLCGLFENILEWHFDAADRKEIFKELKKLRRKQNVILPGESQGSTYLPLLMEYFEIGLTMFPSPIHFDDYWSRAFRRADAIVHPKGTFNMSYELISEKRSLPRNEKKPKQVEDKSLEVFFIENKDRFPLYYSSPTGREYIQIDGEYQFKIDIDNVLYQMLINKLLYVNIGYLGNSEGWVNIKIKEL